MKHKNKKKALTLDDFFLLLYVDDRALNFNSRLDAILGTEIIFEQLARLSQKMYIGTNKKISKTKAVYFTSRSKIKSWIEEYESTILQLSTEENNIVDPNKKPTKMSLKKPKIFRS